MKRALALGAVVTALFALTGCAARSPEANVGVMDSGQRGAIVTNHKSEPLNKALFDAGMQPIIYEHEYPTEPGVVFMPVNAKPFVDAGCNTRSGEALAKCFVKGYFDHPNAFRGLAKPLTGQGVDTFKFDNTLAVYGQRTVSGKIDTYTCQWASSGKLPTAASIAGMPEVVKKQMILPTGQFTLEKKLTIDGVDYNCSRLQYVAPSSASPGR